MQTALATVLRMDLTGSVIIVLLLILRALFPRMSRQIRYLLWLPALVRLLCPWLPEASISLFGLLRTSVSTASLTEPQLLPHALPSGAAVEQMPAVPDPVQFAAWVWLTGLAGMALWTALGSFRLRHRLREAFRLQGNVYLCDQIASPLTFGLFRPRIYLTGGLSPEEAELITAHERVHIRRLDSLLCLLARAALCVHWFNPLVWFAWRLARADMEHSCDEQVIRGLDQEARRRYAGILLRLAGKEVTAAAVAFGRGPRERIENIMRYKKTSRSVLLLSLAGAVFLGACTLTEPAAPQSAASGSAAAHASRDEGEQALFDEYREAGVEVRADGMFFQNQRVHQFTDGLGEITRYQHDDPLGTVDVQVVRAQTPLSDGSVELFGPIIEIRLSNHREEDDHDGVFTENENGAHILAPDDATTVTIEAGHEDSSEASDRSARTLDSRLFF